MQFTRGFLSGARIRMTVATAAVIGAMAVAACGSGGTSTPTGTVTVPSSAAAASSAPGSTTAASPGTGTGAGTCGEGTAALVRQGLTQAGIVSITTDGGCHDVTIVTTLAAADVAKALAICDAAAAIAYPKGDISSVTVTGTNNKELSIGIQGQECIGEP